MTATEGNITPHIIQTEIDGLPFAYQRSILRTDPDRLDETMKEIEDIRKDPASKLKRLKIKPHRHKKRGFLELPDDDEVDAMAVRDTINSALRDKGRTVRVGVEPAYLANEPDGRMLGMTVKHGHGVGGIFGTTRFGVHLVGFGPPARSAADLEAGRRPVVAVLDTPVREHPWLGDGDGEDAFWSDARRVGDPWEPKFEVPTESSDGQLSHAGHGTFIAGIVRLLAPDARVLSVPVMHSDGIVEEEHAYDALVWIRDRVSEAADGRSERFVDVVNLSFGRYEEAGESPADSSEMHSVLDELAELGVRVVASAGNEAKATRVLPAAFSKERFLGLFSEENDPDRTALISVGARDPDGTLAAYTSTGDWVTVNAPGTALVSTLPTFDPTEFPLPKDLDKSGDPTHPDPNFQASGIGQWSGTSFAAAWVSASIAAKLLEQAMPGSLVDNSSAAASARAKSAWDAVVADINYWVARHGLVD